jgi:cytochrome P450
MSRLRWHDAAVNLAAHPIAWPLARAIRRVGGVVRVPGLGMVINDAETAHDILTRDDLFTKNGHGSISESMTVLFGPSALGNMDGESHRVLRAKLAGVVSAPRAAELLSACAPAIATLQRELASGHTVDLVAWMRLLSGRITLDMLGIAPPAGAGDAQCLELVALGERIVSGFDLQPSAAWLDRARTDAAHFADQVRVGFERADAPPGSFVRRLRDAGFSFDEARGVVSVLFIAGTLTTAAALPRIVALLVDGGHLAALGARPDAVTGAISEGLRYSTPVPATVRIARRDTDVGGQRVRAGERLLILTCNTARDAALFPEPDRFDPARPHNPRARYLWYGAGPHFCLGFPVAQAQLDLVIRALLELPGTLRVVRRRAARGVVVPRYARLDVRVERSGS